jgi:hypothetical protein
MPEWGTLECELWSQTWNEGFPALEPIAAYVFESVRPAGPGN